MKPDWRDPNMPVLVQYKDENGRTILKLTPPEVVTEIHAIRMWQIELMILGGQHEFDWRRDPTYNLRRKKDV